MGVIKQFLTWFNPWAVLTACAAVIFYSSAAWTTVKNDHQEIQQLKETGGVALIKYIASTDERMGNLDKRLERMEKISTDVSDIKGTTLAIQRQVDALAKALDQHEQRTTRDRGNN